MAAIDVARAREDDRLAESYREVLDTILMAFPADSHLRKWHGYGGPDLVPIEAVVSEMARTEGLVERAERGLNLLLDAGQPPAADRLRELLEWAQRGSFRPLEAEPRRGLGGAGRAAAIEAAAAARWEGVTACRSPA